MFVALALIKVSMAVPTDFSIDMYEGSNHLRYDRSAEAGSSGTSVTVETANAPKVEQTSDKILPVDEAMKFAQNIMSHLEEESSKGQPTKAEPVHVHQDAETIAADAALTKETAAAAAKDTKDAVTKTEEIKTDVHKKPETAAAAEEKLQKSVSTSVTEITTGENTEKLSTKSKYINKYGDVLYRINKDKVNPLASKSRSKSAQKSSSKKLSGAPSGNSNIGGKSNTQSYLIRNGQIVSDMSQLNSNPQPQQAFGKPQGFMGHNPAAYGNGFGASPYRSGYGAPAGFGGAPAGYGAPVGFGGPVGFGAEGTYNLMTRTPQQNYRRGGAITMLNSGRPGPMIRF